MTSCDGPQRLGFVIVPRPRLSPTCAHTVFTEYASAVVRSMFPNGWLLSLESGTPDTVIGDFPLTMEFGVYFPLSRAAVAVTTLNVDPGG